MASDTSQRQAKNLQSTTKATKN